MSPACKVSVTYRPPSLKLRRFFSGFFLVEIDVESGGPVEDFTFPDWAAVRFNHEPTLTGSTRYGEILPQTRLSVSGPRSHEIYVRAGTLRQWAATIHPLGWALLIGEPADEYANRLLDGMAHPAFARFRPLTATLFGSEPDPDGELRRLIEFFEGIEPLDDPAAGEIAGIYAGLLDKGIDAVSALMEHAGVSRRKLERLCRRAFGFPPKLLLRRQRFLRSLSDFTVDPSLKWIGAMDGAYHDQAQFIRDFREFMGMTPSEYHQAEKPVVSAIIRERVRYAREMAKTPLGLPGTRKDG